MTDGKAYQQKNSKQTSEKKQTLNINLREILGRPLVIHSVFMRLLGDMNAALMLSQAVYWLERIPESRNGAFYKTQEEWEAETFLGRRSQDNARMRLRQYDFWEEWKEGVPARLWFRVDEAKLLAALTSTEERFLDVDQCISIYKTKLKALSKGALIRAKKYTERAKYVDYAKVLMTHGLSCYICGHDITDGPGMSSGSLQFDHVVALTAGGDHCIDNIRPAHSECNNSKSNRPLNPVKRPVCSNSATLDAEAEQSSPLTYSLTGCSNSATLDAQTQRTIHENTCSKLQHEITDIKTRRPAQPAAVVGGGLRGAQDSEFHTLENSSGSEDLSAGVSALPTRGNLALVSDTAAADLPEADTPQPDAETATPEETPAAKNTFGPEIRQGMAALISAYGAIPDNKAQGKALKWLLSNGWEISAAIECFNDLRAEGWRTSRVSFLTVQKEIGAWALRQKDEHDQATAIEVLPAFHPDVEARTEKGRVVSITYRGREHKRADYQAQAFDALVASLRVQS